MDERQFYTQIFGIQAPWSVTDVKLDVKGEEVVVHVAADPLTNLPCPDCGTPSSRYDKRARRWRHLDTCQFKTIIEADVPRVRCPEHGVVQVCVPWAAVAERCRLSWDQVDTIMKNAVERGLARRKVEAPERIGVDETSFQKRHEYVTTVVDLDNPRVLHVADHRKAALSRMATRRSPSTKFHVAAHLGDAVDRVRRWEHRELLLQGDETLKGSKFLWLMNPANMTRPEHIASFEVLRSISLRTSRAWAFKEAAISLWGYLSRGHARNAWRKWIAWARRSQLEPVKRVAAMIRDHLPGILTAIVTRTTNASSESVNAKIQWIKRTACGFRNRDRFRSAIYFHLGGLDLHPASCGITHTDA